VKSLLGGASIEVHHFLTNDALRASAHPISTTVQKWEVGQKRPTGIALKLLHLVQEKGLDIVF
jgi:DNA-binding transcriptional regulator YiaG